MDEERTGWEGPPRGFESEARERLATVEAHQENIEGKVDGLDEGQSEIIDRLESLDENFVREDELQPVVEKAQKNAQTRQRAKAIIKFIVVALSLIGGASGLILFMV